MGISSQARAILQILADSEPVFAEFDERSRSYKITIKTFAWYNGNERGVALTVQRDPNGRCLVITFGETSNSDRVFVEHWLMEDAPINGPRVEDLEAVNSYRKDGFPPQNYSEVVVFILQEMQSFYGAQGQVRVS